MQIDTSRVFTDKHRDAINRLAKSDLTRREFEEILQELPDWIIGPSKDQFERIRQLESEGRLDEALAEGVRIAFAVKITEALISGRIMGRLDGVDNLPDQMLELERIAENEMGSEVAEVECSLADTFVLPTNEVLRVYSRVIGEAYERLEREYRLKKTKREREQALGISDSTRHDYLAANEEKVDGEDVDGKPGPTAEFSPINALTERGKVLAEICPLFRQATPEIQQEVWNTLVDFKRKQWALFFIKTNSTGKSDLSMAEAVKTIIKPIANSIEEISGLTNMRGISIDEGSRFHRRDCKQVDDIVNVLKATAVLRKRNLLP